MLQQTCSILIIYSFVILAAQLPGCVPWPLSFNFYRNFDYNSTLINESLLADSSSRGGRLASDFPCPHLISAMNHTRSNCHASASPLVRSDEGSNSFGGLGRSVCLAAASEICSYEACSIVAQAWG